VGFVFGGFLVLCFFFFCDVVSLFLLFFLAKRAPQVPLQRSLFLSSSSSTNYANTPLLASPIPENPKLSGGGVGRWYPLAADPANASP